MIDIPWPKYYFQFINLFNFINLDFLPWNTLSCLQLFTFYHKLKLFTLVPLIIIFLVYLIYLLPRYYIKYLKHRRYQLKAGKNSPIDSLIISFDYKLERRKFWKIILFTLFLIYPLVSAMIFKFFICIEVNEVLYLQIDMSIECYDDLWFNQLYYVLTMIVIYPLGIPLFFYYFLNRYYQQHRLHDLEIKMQLGFLYEAYQTQYWWFELIEMSYKLLMSSFISFLPFDYQMKTAIMLTILYLIYHLYTMPYLRSSDDRLQLLSLIEIFLLITVAHLIVTLGVNYDNDANTIMVLSIILITLTSSVFIAFLILSIQSIDRMIYKYISQNKEKQSEKGYSWMYRCCQGWYTITHVCFKQYYQYKRRKKVLKSNTQVKIQMEELQQQYKEMTNDQLFEHNQREIQHWNKTIKDWIIKNDTLVD